jgi:hypothetical protein
MMGTFEMSERNQRNKAPAINSKWAADAKDKHLSAHLIPTYLTMVQKNGWPAVNYYGLQGIRLTVANSMLTGADTTVTADRVRDLFGFIRRDAPVNPRRDPQMAGSSRKRPMSSRVLLATPGNNQFESPGIVRGFFSTQKNRLHAESSRCPWRRIRCRYWTSPEVLS